MTAAKATKAAAKERRPRAGRRPRSKEINSQRRRLSRTTKLFRRWRVNVSQPGPLRLVYYVVPGEASPPHHSKAELDTTIQKTQNS